MDPYLIILCYLIIGIFAGFLGGLFGIGGGLLTVPALVLLFYLSDMPNTYVMQTAIGTSLAAMIFTAASSAWAHYKYKGIYWNLFKILTPSVLIGSVLGAFIADYLPSRELKIIFSYFIAIIAMYFLFPTIKPTSSPNKEPTIYNLGLWGLGIGATSSLMGIGGGIFTVPVLTYFKTPLKNAISTSAAIGFVIALSGAITFFLLGMSKEITPNHAGYLYLPAFICIGITSTLSAPWGAKLAYRLPTQILKRFFGLFLLFISLLMIYF